MSADLAPTIGADEARERLARVRAHVEQAGTDLTALYQGRAWLALGHDSWESLCDAELGGVRIALPRAERREVVAGMREAGLSTRAIGTALGTSEATVRRDLATASYDAVGTVTGLDGRTRPAKVTTTEKVERHVDLDTGEIVADPYAAGAAAADAVVLPDIPGLSIEPSLMTRFLGSVSRAWDVTRYSPEHVAEAADAQQWSALTDLVDSLNRWRDRAESARPKALRIIGGDK